MTRPHFTTIADLRTYLQDTMGLAQSAQEIEDAIRQHHDLFGRYERMTAQEYATLARAVYEGLTGDGYPSDWAQQDAGEIEEEGETP